MARRILNRKDLRNDYDAAERRKEEDEEVDEASDESEEDEEEASDEEEAEGDEEEAAEAEDEEKPEKPEKPKKKKPAPKPKAKPRSRAVKVTRMRVVWGVFNNSNQCVATYEYPRRKEADAHAAKLMTDKKSTHFVQPIKEPIEQKKEE